MAKDELVKKEQEEVDLSLRFTDMVLSKLKSSVPQAMEVNDYQRSLIGGYAIAIKRALAVAEEQRVAKNKKNTDHKWDIDVPVTLSNVDREKLAVDLVHYAKLGLDMTQDNMLFPIPFYDWKTRTYTINLMRGYNGVKYIAEKYALHPPKAVTIEVVYSTDEFKIVKKDNNNKVEGYTFNVNNPFDRGEIVGGFAYIAYDTPEMNELIVMSMKDILKRKPKYASATFWGGETTEKVGAKNQTVAVEGWLDDMVRKTLIREAYSPKHILLDPSKIDDNYQYIKDRESQYTEVVVQSEVAQNANTVEVDLPAAPIDPATTGAPSAKAIEAVTTGTIPADAINAVPTGSAPAAEPVVES